MGASRVTEGGDQAFALPDVGEGLTEAEIVTWRVQVGDTVAVNDVLVEIETAKSVVELPSPFAGVVTAILVDEGSTVPVGTPLVTIADEATASGREPTLVGYGARTSGPRRRRKVPTTVGTVVPIRSGTDDHGHHGPRRVRVKPPVRKLAKDLGIDVADVPATGPVVTRADVQAYAAARSSQAPTVPAQGVPVRGVQKAMAEAMIASARSAPQATEWLDVDVSRTVEFMDRLQQDPAFAAVRVTPTVIVAKAVCLALRHAPNLNARWIQEGSGEAEVQLREAVNLGLAVATERGLLVPNVKAAEQLSLVELGTAIGALTDAAREGRTQPADQAGGTFTITNVGVFGVDGGTPILPVGEAGILAVGAIQRRPWVSDEDTIVPRWVATLALTFDHRIADGAEAAHFLTEVAGILQDPARALTF